MTLEDALGRKPEDLEDFVLAQVMFPIIKHLDLLDPMQEAKDRIDRMTNTEFLSALSIGLENLLESKA